MRTSFDLSPSKSVERIVVLLRRPSEHAPREDDERFQRALDEIDRLPARLKKSMESIEGVLARPLIPISVMWEKRLSTSSDLNAHLMGTAKGIRTAEISSQTRALVSLLPIRDSTAAPETLPGHSHIVAVALDPGSDQIKWRAARGLSSAIVEASLESYSTVLEDIFLDIALFHSWPQLAEAFQDTAARRIFSHRKVKFILEHVTDVPLPLAGLAGLTYVSFATVARKGNRLDVNRYVELWRSFMASLGAKEPPNGARPPGGSRLAQKRRATTASIRNVTNEDAEVTVAPGGEAATRAEEFIFRYHRKGQQISRRKLRRILASLSPGKYVLVRTESKPRLKKAQATLNGLFGARRWKTGRLLVAPATDFQLFRSHRRYVSVFRFVIDVGGPIEANISES